MPLQYRVAISPQAEGDIQDAFTWITDSDPAAALRWYAGLMESIRTLGIFPERCPLSPEARLGLTETETRQLLFGRNYWKYRILFAIDGDQIVVVHVRHAARQYLGEPEADETV